MTVSTVTPLPAAPNRATMPEATFSDAADDFTAAMVVMGTEWNTSIGQFNADAATVNSNVAAVEADRAEVATNLEAVQDIWSDFVTEDVSGGTGTSVDSVSIGTGSKSFPNASTGKLWFAGMAIMVRSGASPSNFMAGSVTSYNPTTGALVISSKVFGGSGTFTDWVIYPSARLWGQDWTEIASQATTSGSAVTFSNIPQTYQDISLEFLGVSGTGTGALNIELSDDGTNWTGTTRLLASTVAATSYYGKVEINGYRRPAGHIIHALADLPSDRSSTAPGGNNIAWRIDAGISAIRISLASGSFDAGSIKLLGK